MSSSDQRPLPGVLSAALRVFSRDHLLELPERQGRDLCAVLGRRMDMVSSLTAVEIRVLAQRVATYLSHPALSRASLLAQSLATDPSKTFG